MDSEETTKVNTQALLKFTKLRICKNLATISSSFLLLFIAFNGLTFLQSTMNKEQGMGIMSEVAVFGGFMVFSLILPKYCVKNFGCKTTLLVAISLFLPYIASNFYPAWGSLLPSGLLCGIGFSILFGSQSTYFNKSAFLYCTVAQGVLIDYTTTNIATNSNRTSIEELSIAETIEQYDEVHSSPNFPIESQNNIQSNSNNLFTHGNSQELYVRKMKDILEEAVTMINFRKNSDKEQSLEVKPPKELTEDICCNIKSFQSNIAPNIEITKEKLNAKEHADALARIEKVAPIFFGCHGFMFNSSLILCNLMSHFVLQRDDRLSHVISNIAQNFSCSCGASFCNNEGSCGEELIAEPSLEIRYLLTGILVLLVFLAIFLVLMCLDELEHEKEPIAFSLDTIMATLNQGKNIKQIFLIPLMVYYGMEQAFYIGDYTKSFIACAMGTSNVGLVTIFFGLSCALSSTLSGLIIRLIGRVPVFISAGIANVGANLYLLWWTPNPNDPYLFFLGALLWGSFTGLFGSQLPAFTGVLFKGNEEAAFAFFYLCMSSGFSIMFILSDHICTNYKIFILLVTSTFGIIGYLITEYLYHSRRDK